MAITPKDLLAAIQSDPTLLAMADVGNDAGVAAAMNTVSTSCAAPATLTVDGILGLLSEPSLARLSLHPSAPAIRDDLTKQDRAAIAHWAVLLAARPDPAATGTITIAERQAVLAALQEEVDTPCTPAEKIGAMGDMVAPVDVALALESKRVDDAIAAFLAITWPAVNVHIPQDRADAAGLTELHLAATKARHEGTALGVDAALRADAIALVAKHDAKLADTLTAEAAAAAGG